MQFRDLGKQYETLKGEIDAAMQKVASESHYIMGPEVKELEQQLASYVGVKHCISCANGTDALTIALKIWGIGPGDAVFVPDFTFFSSAEVVAGEGAEPVFVDVKEESFNIDPADLEKAIQETLAEGRLTPKAIVAVDLFGLPADFPAIREIAQKYGLKVLEDGAQGFGGGLFLDDFGQICEHISDSPCELHRACSFGDIATTSFFPAKPLGCYGDGGAIFTDNDQWAALAESIRVHGKGTMKYDNVRLGLNSRLDTLQAAILKVKLKAFEDYELQAVNEAAVKYDSALPGFNTPVIPEGYLSSWAQYTLRLESEEQRSGIQERLKGLGIPTMVYYPTPMSGQTAFKALKKRNCPVAAKLCKTVLSLPMHPYITDEEIKLVANAIKL